MSDIGSDADAAVEMAAAAENRLIATNRGHPLVAYLFVTNDEERETAWQKQLRSFSKDPQAEGNVRGVMETTYAMSMYLLALEVALGERVPPKEPESSDGVHPAPTRPGRWYYDDEVP